jgi:antitoxin component HigA of HigAB toxin-antitoxin module
VMRCYGAARELCDLSGVAHAGKYFRQMKGGQSHPGEMLREDFLRDYGLTVSGLVKAIGVSCKMVSKILRKRQA